MRAADGLSIVDRFRRWRASRADRQEADPQAQAPGRTISSWDGGWRRVAPITPMIQRAAPLVGDGLRFRDRLASWQDLTFGSTLGHSISPTAPVGTMHGVVRYRSPGASMVSAGGPLLLRSHDVTLAGNPVSPTGTALGNPALAGNSAAPGAEPKLREQSDHPAVQPGATHVDARSDAGSPVRPHALGPPLTVARRIAHLPKRELPTIRSAVQKPVAASVMPVVQHSSGEQQTAIGEPIRAMPPSAVTIPIEPTAPTEPTTGESPGVLIERPLAADAAAPPATVQRVLESPPSGAATHGMVVDGPMPVVKPGGTALDAQPSIRRSPELPAVSTPVRPAAGSAAVANERSSVAGDPVHPIVDVVQRHVSRPAPSDTPASPVPQKAAQDVDPPETRPLAGDEPMRPLVGDPVQRVVAEPHAPAGQPSSGVAVPGVVVDGPMPVARPGDATSDAQPSVVRHAPERPATGGAAIAKEKPAGNPVRPVVDVVQRKVSGPVTNDPPVSPAPPGAAQDVHPFEARPLIGDEPVRPLVGGPVQRAVAEAHAPAGQPLSLALGPKAGERSAGEPASTPAPGIGEPLPSLPATAVLLSGTPASSVSASSTSMPGTAASAVSVPAVSSTQGSSMAPAMSMPVVQRTIDDSQGSASKPPLTKLTPVARAIGHGGTGSVPAAGPADRILPLLPARPLIRLAEPSTQAGEPNRVARAVWRRTHGDGRDATHQIGQPPARLGEGHGVDLVAMGSTPRKPTHPTQPRSAPRSTRIPSRQAVALQRVPLESSVSAPALPVTLALRAPLTSEQPVIDAGAVARPVFGQPVPINSVPISTLPTGTPPARTVPTGTVPVSTVIARAPAANGQTPIARQPSRAGTVPTGSAVPIARTAPASSAGPTVDGIDMDELARRLFEPISRLLRADLRQGRERAGRMHDRRR